METTVKIVSARDIRFDRSLPDFLVCDDRTIYEGRPLKVVNLNFPIERTREVVEEILSDCKPSDNANMAYMNVRLATRSVKDSRLEVIPVTYYDAVPLHESVPLRTTEY